MRMTNLLFLETLVIACFLFGVDSGPVEKSERPRCGLKHLDLMFTLDSSYSLQKEDFTRLKHFANSIIKGLRKQGIKLEVGVVKFGATAKVEVDLDNNFSRAELEDAINSIKQDGEFNTNTHLGINVARHELSEKASCACAAPKTIILLTDGFPSYGRSAFLESRIARELGYHVFVVAVGADSSFQGASVDDLASLFADGYTNRVVRVQKASDLDSFVDSFTRTMCGDYRQSPRTTPHPMTQEFYEKEWPLFNA